MANKDMVNVAGSSQKKCTLSLSEAEIRYSALFEQSPDGILVIDEEGEILDFNRAAHTDLGYTREEFAKFNVSDIDPVETPEEIRSHIQKTIGKGKAEFEVTHRTKSGQVRNVLIITQTIVLSGRSLLHVIWRDITERKKAEIELIQHKKNLEEKVQDRTKDLQKVINSLAGRETRMIELKRVIEKLRKQLTDAGMNPVANDPLKEP